jgi:hypothetical protein
MSGERRVIVGADPADELQAYATPCDTNVPAFGE